MRNWFLFLLAWHFIGLLRWKPPPPMWVRQVYALVQAVLFITGVYFYLRIMP